MYLDLTGCSSVGLCQERSLIRIENLENILRKIEVKRAHTFHQNERAGVYNEGKSVENIKLTAY